MTQEERDLIKTEIEACKKLANELAAEADETGDVLRADLLSGLARDQSNRVKALQWVLRLDKEKR